MTRKKRPNHLTVVGNTKRQQEKKEEARWPAPDGLSPDGHAFFQRYCTEVAAIRGGVLDSDLQQIALALHGLLDLRYLRDQLAIEQLCGDTAAVLRLLPAINAREKLHAQALSNLGLRSVSRGVKATQLAAAAGQTVQTDNDWGDSI